MNSYYDDDIISYIDHSILLNPFFEEWFEIVEPILRNDEFQKRKLGMQGIMNYLTCIPTTTSLTAQQPKLRESPRTKREHTPDLSVGITPTPDGEITRTYRPHP